jgi:hypothetical protein
MGTGSKNDSFLCRLASGHGSDQSVSVVGAKPSCDVFSKNYPMSEVSRRPSILKLTSFA